MSDQADDIDILRQWLGGLGRDLSIPMPRLNGESVAVLKKLMEASQERDRVEMRLAKEARRKAQEWLELGEKDAAMLQDCGIALTNVTPSLRTSLETLSSSAVSLGTQDASQHSLNGAVLELDRGAAEVKALASGQNVLAPVLQREHETAKARLEQLQTFEEQTLKIKATDELEKRRRGDSIRYLNLKAKQYETSL
eukprot:3668576-Rhodomonas_salina.1